MASTALMLRILPMAIVGAIYVGLSVVFFMAQTVPRIKASVESFWNGLFIFGPPVALIHRLEFLWFYLLSSLLFWGFAVAAARAQSTERKLLWIGLCMIAWCASGFIATGIMV